MIPIKIAGPERLTFVHQINTGTSDIASRLGDRGKEMSHVQRYIAYLSRSLCSLSLSPFRFGRSGRDDANTS